MDLRLNQCEQQSPLITSLGHSYNSELLCQTATRLAKELRLAMSPSERAFLEAGANLSQAHGNLRGLEDKFALLTDSISSKEAQSAASGLGLAVDSIIGMMKEESGIQTLSCLTSTVASLARPLSSLKSLADEVNMLVMNAKILSSQLSTGRVEFIHFTAEMHRLGVLAAETADNALASQARLGQALKDAASCNQEFTSHSAVEVADLRRNIDHGLALLNSRRQSAVLAAQAVRERAAAQANLLADSIQALQINDITCQRIEHAAAAFELLAECLEKGTEELSNQQSLAAVVGQLQKEQIHNANSEFKERVRTLASNFKLMACEAKNIIQDADSSFTGSDATDSFAGTLKADVTNAVRLAEGFVEMRANLVSSLNLVQEALTQIVRHLNSITSIRADMHIMGLNATLKCGHLGADGKALAVVAHDLRVCSNRTEEIVCWAASRLEEIRNLEAQLNETVNRTNRKQLHDALDAMRFSLNNVEQLGNSLDSALESLRKDGTTAAEILESTASSLAIENEVGLSLERITDELSEISATEYGLCTDMGNLRSQVSDLLSGQYTMASERLIHQLVADGGGSQSEEMQAASPEQDVDDFFL